ncbi:hypothetical protein ACE6ED_02530 [Paenibacillus sp. CN-4]|uniref:hypothetical protein n=1 Tax=Paenibacillus nanchangensis TaxID=3348343 RepID=UPI00397E2FDC
MPWIHHINYKTENNQVYCCMRNKIVTLTEDQLAGFCVGCKMFGGTALGQGVECFWNDSEDVPNPHHVHEPEREFRRLQTRTAGVR